MARYRGLIALFALMAWVVWRVWTILALDARPDPRENFIAEEVLRIRSGGSPTLYNWPGTPWVFLLASLSRIFAAGDVEAIVGVGRLCTVVFAALSLWGIWVVSEGLSGRRVAWVAPGLVGVSAGFSAAEANLALVDHLALAFMVWGVVVAGFSAGRVSGRGALWIPLVAGALVGFGGAAKFTSLLAAAPVGVLVAGGFWGCRRRVWGGLGLVVLGIMVGFVVGCPYVVSDAGAVFAGFGYEAGHYRKGHFGLFATAHDGSLSALLRHANAFGWSFGFVLAGVCVVLAGVGAVRRGRWSWALAGVHAWALVGSGALVVQTFSFARHWLVVLPPVALLAVEGLCRLPRRWGRLGWCVLVVAAVHSTATTFALNWLERGPSSIRLCEAWVRDVMGASHEPVSVSVGLEEPVFRWVYPGVCFEHGSRAVLGETDLVVVAELEADAQMAIEENPWAYEYDNFFPLTRGHFVSGRMHRALRETRPVVAEFGRVAPWWVGDALFLGRALPFPWDALHQPLLVVYGRP